VFVIRRNRRGSTICIESIVPTPHEVPDELPRFRDVSFGIERSRSSLRRAQRWKIRPRSTCGKRTGRYLPHLSEPSRRVHRM